MLVVIGLSSLFLVACGQSESDILANTKTNKDLRDVPQVLVTDQRRSDEASLQEIMPRVEHRPHERLHNPARFRPCHALTNRG
jgi:hypothetical protein